MKSIAWQPNVLLENVDGSHVLQRGERVDVTFREFIESRLIDPAFAGDMDAVLAASRIRAALKALDNNHPLELEDEDCERLIASVRRPRTGYNPKLAHNFVGFMQSICAAETKDDA